jgi:4'-phosphopantetheinyl transferase
MNIIPIIGTEKPSFENLKLHSFHVWKMPLTTTDEELHTLESILDENEKKQAQAFVIEQVRKNFIAAHGNLRKVLAMYLNLNSQEVEFNFSQYKKPYLIQNREIQFNLSHSHDMAVVAVAFNKPIGIDIESLHRNNIDFIGLAKNTFTAQEFLQLEQADPENTKHYFYTLWTQKEAIIKAIGKGFYYPLDKFIVSATGDIKTITLPDMKVTLKLSPVEIAKEYICYVALQQ